MNQVTNFQDEVQTMTSREIAELTGKRHPDVKRDIEVMMKALEIDVSIFARIYLDTQNRQQTEYALDRFHTEVLVTGYDVARRAAVIKRWHELETGKAQPAAQAPLPPTPMQSAVSDMQAWKDAAAIFRVPESLALVEGVKHVAIAYSIDFQPLLLASPAMNDIQDKDVMLEPTEIGRVLDMSAREVNAMLGAAGLQVKTGGQWVPTEAAKGYYSKHLWLSPNSGKSGYNLKWNLDFVRKSLGK